jgi:hypothetical protein
MICSVSNAFDRFASTSVLALMLAGLPLGGLMFIVNSGVI